MYKGMVSEYKWREMAISGGGGYKGFTGRESRYKRRASEYKVNKGRGSGYQGRRSGCIRIGGRLQVVARIFKRGVTCKLYSTKNHTLLMSVIVISKFTYIASYNSNKILAFSLLRGCLKKSLHTSSTLSSV